MTELAEHQRNVAPSVARLEALELSRAQFEAEVGGALLKADGKLKAAAASEARERQMRKSNERLADSLDLEIEAPEEAGAVLPRHVAGSETDGLPPVHLGVAANNKAGALRAKWGG